MINNAQKEMLDSFFAEDGILFETVNESNLDRGTKIIYLNRAITQDCQIFLQSLDKLYDDEEDNIELIRALKNINNLCFNNEIKNGEHGIQSALTPFLLLGENAQPDDFKNAIQDMINERIAELTQGHEEEVARQTAERERVERAIVPVINWREMLDLPHNQLVPLQPHYLREEPQLNAIDEIEEEQLVVNFDRRAQALLDDRERLEQREPVQIIERRGDPRLRQFERDLQRRMRARVWEERRLEFDGDGMEDVRRRLAFVDQLDEEDSDTENENFRP